MQAKGQLGLHNNALAGFLQDYLPQFEIKNASCSFSPTTVTIYFLVLGSGMPEEELREVWDTIDSSSSEELLKTQRN
ncbi:hypothetical protein OUZ56_000304 [Daphnia magna]|uniref:Uncharacterized protein n=1 Tax=Daphnia magna TaxID=35525 RepID=A0ABQ9ZZ96_9CRUS|nr:hypothetical protein OUZ56_000304 [Daphnia magna]